MFSREWFEKKFGKIEDRLWNKIEDWAHTNCADGYQGAIGGSVTIEITPTSIGSFIVLSTIVNAYTIYGEPVYDEYGKPLKVRTCFRFPYEM